MLVIYTPDRSRHPSGI